jgi:hypothetical protein
MGCFFQTRATPRTKLYQHMTPAPRPPAPWTCLIDVNCSFTVVFFGTPDSSSNKTESHYITESLLKVVLSILTLFFDYMC